MYETMWMVFTNAGIPVGEFGVMFGDDDDDANYALLVKSFKLWCEANALDYTQHNYCGKASETIKM